MDDIAKAAYLAAFIDGEGHIGIHPVKTGQWTRHVAFTNTDKQLFDRIVAIAADLGLTFRTYHRKASKPGWSDTWIAYLAGGKADYERFERLVPLQSDRKRRRLSDLIAGYVTSDALKAIHEKRRTKQTVRCGTCGSVFLAFPADIKRGQGKFCSVKCGAISRRRQVSNTCSHCGETYSTIAARGRVSRFCSSRCRNLANGNRIREYAKIAADARWAG